MVDMNNRLLYIFLMYKLLSSTAKYSPVGFFGLYLSIFFFSGL